MAAANEVGAIPYDDLDSDRPFLRRTPADGAGEDDERHTVRVDALLSALQQLRDELRRGAGGPPVS